MHLEKTSSDVREEYHKNSELYKGFVYKKRVLQMKNAIIVFTSVLLAQVSFGQVKLDQQAPEISLPDLNGKTINLSTLKGKVVLLDFWASWCLPCRKNNPSLVKLYEKFKEQGFEVYSVSLDSKEKDWKKAVEQDNLKWPLNVYDKKGWYAKSTYDYGVDSIPLNFLIDKEGKIKGINIPHNDLESKIDQLLKGEALTRKE
jgi:peroxiredoxin